MLGHVATSQHRADRLADTCGGAAQRKNMMAADYRHIGDPGE
jgi:hypothetical protein